MSIKPTSFHKKARKPLPEYEPIAKEEEATVSEACCVCDNPGSISCNPENPNGPAAMNVWAGAQAIAFWVDAK